MCKPEIRFDIVNPVTNGKRPHYDKSKDLFLFPVDTKYRYYVEARNIDKDTIDKLAEELEEYGQENG